MWHSEAQGSKGLKLSELSNTPNHVTEIRIRKHKIVLTSQDKKT